jgi:hypothetical protein
VLVQAAGNARHRIGDDVTVAMRATDAHYFDAGGHRIPVHDAALRATA